MKPTDQLHDIEGLDTIPWWPLAPGWWLLIGIVLLLIMIGIILLHRRRQAKNKYPDWRVIAKREWLSLHPSQGSPRDQLIFLSILLRRVAIQRHGRESCAGLSGKDWLAWLTKNDPQGFDWQKNGRIIIELPYCPPGTPIDEAEVKTLYQAIQAWIEF
jgi:hypothetical protein